MLSLTTEACECDGGNTKRAGIFRRKALCPSLLDLCYSSSASVDETLT
jgi:hypothetical protein